MDEPSGQPMTGTAQGTEQEHSDHDDAVEQELLVEEISIDGMCGVY